MCPVPASQKPAGVVCLIAGCSQVKSRDGIATPQVFGMALAWVVLVESERELSRMGFAIQQLLDQELLSPQRLLSQLPPLVLGPA